MDKTITEDQATELDRTTLDSNIVNAETVVQDVLEPNPSEPVQVDDGLYKPDQGDFDPFEPDESLENRDTDVTFHMEITPEEVVISERLIRKDMWDASDIVYEAEPEKQYREYVIRETKIPVMVMFTACLYTLASELMKPIYFPTYLYPTAHQIQPDDHMNMNPHEMVVAARIYTLVNELPTPRYSWKYIYSDKHLVCSDAYYGFDFEAERHNKKCLLQLQMNGFEAIIAHPYVDTGYRPPHSDYCFVFHPADLKTILKEIESVLRESSKPAPTE